jgi:hypothetical protein
MKFLTSLLPFSGAESKKSQAFVLAAILIVTGKLFGLSEEAMKDTLYLTIAYLGGQGLADFGKEAKKGTE